MNTCRPSGERCARSVWSSSSTGWMMRVNSMTSRTLGPTSATAGTKLEASTQSNAAARRRPIIAHGECRE
jgi:hypothetical protein